MSATTSLKLSGPVKEEISGLASRLGVSAQGFMIEALQNAVRDAKLRQQFCDDGAEAWAEVQDGGPVYDGNEVFAYFRAKLKAKPEERDSIPVPRPIEKTPR